MRRTVPLRRAYCWPRRVAKAALQILRDVLLVAVTMLIFLHADTVLLT